MSDRFAPRSRFAPPPPPPPGFGFPPGFPPGFPGGFGGFAPPAPFGADAQAAEAQAREDARSAAEAAAKEAARRDVDAIRRAEADARRAVDELFRDSDDSFEDSFEDEDLDEELTSEELRENLAKLSNAVLHGTVTEAVDLAREVEDLL